MSRFKKTIIKIKNTYFLFYCFPKISSNDLPKKKKKNFFVFAKFAISVRKYSFAVSPHEFLVPLRKFGIPVRRNALPSFSPRVSPHEFLPTSFSSRVSREFLLARSPPESVLRRGYSIALSAREFRFQLLGTGAFLDQSREPNVGHAQIWRAASSLSEKGLRDEGSASQ